MKRTDLEIVQPPVEGSSELTLVCDQRLFNIRNDPVPKQEVLSSLYFCLERVRASEVSALTPRVLSSSDHQ